MSEINFKQNEDSNTPLPLNANIITPSAPLSAFVPSKSTVNHPYANNTTITTHPFASQVPSIPNNNTNNTNNNSSPKSSPISSPISKPSPKSKNRNKERISNVERKARESIKAQKIKEYFGISANINDVDFAALQEDILELKKSLEGSDDDISLDDEDDSLEYQSDMDIESPDSLSSELISDITLQSSEPIAGDTSINENDEEIKILRRYEKEQYEIGWRWYWLHLQYHETLKNIELVNNEILKVKQEKQSSFIQNNNNSSMRCNGWNKLESYRKIQPSSYRFIHVRISNNDHPLFSEKPNTITFPNSKKLIPTIEEIDEFIPKKKRSHTKVSSRSNLLKSPDKNISRRITRSEVAKAQKKRSHTRKTSDYDIDNVVLPTMMSVQKIRKIEYKEIHTPGFRVIDENSINQESSEDENTDDEKYLQLHSLKEKEERKKFSIPLPPSHLLKKKQRKSLTQSAPAVILEKKHTPITSPIQKTPSSLSNNKSINKQISPNNTNNKPTTTPSPTTIKTRKQRTRTPSFKIREALETSLSPPPIKKTTKKRKSTTISIPASVVASTISKTPPKTSPKTQQKISPKVNTKPIISEISPKSSKKKQKTKRKSSKKKKKKKKKSSTSIVIPSIVNDNYRYPNSDYVSSIPSLTAITSPPTHSHNTRRSSFFKQKLSNNTDSNSMSLEDDSTEEDNEFLNLDNNLDTIKVGEKRKRKEQVKWVVSKKSFCYSSKQPSNGKLILYINKVVT